MKKYLAALIAAGLVAGAGAAEAGKGHKASASGIKLSVGGYMEQWVGFGDNDKVGTKELQDVDVQSDTEIFMHGSAKLRNGMTAGAFVSLEGNTESDYISASYGYLKGNFGKVILGAHHGAASMMQVTSTDVGIGINHADHKGDQFKWVDSSPAFGKLSHNMAASALVTTTAELGQHEAQKITYMSPRTNGLMVGVSYTPDADFTGDTNALVDKNSNLTDGLAVSAHYETKVSGMNVEVSLGHQTFDAPAGSEDPAMTTAGLKVSKGAFTIGGSYADISDGIVENGLSNEGTGYDLGASYDMGATTVSVNYYKGDAEGTSTDADELEHETVAVSAAYELGKGVELVGTLGSAEYTNEANVETDGTFFVVGTRFQF